MALILLEECNALLARCTVYTRVTDGIYKLITNYGMTSPRKDKYNTRKMHTYIVGSLHDLFAWTDGYRIMCTKLEIMVWHHPGKQGYIKKIVCTV